ncbi:hypothetical protein NECAME_02628 [Necator americanus]|uniref:Uncharacterized protein n=1 Tax=Necator americanus TaxID=51031 RepID=W2TD38_NECAM|nr:hypothetical protein NECAME_02628 [Necator americanus]ETN79509.1 hypothetical protein NECAME_02628 [Necator americanus]
MEWFFEGTIGGNVDLIGAGTIVMTWLCVQLAQHVFNRTDVTGLRHGNRNPGVFLDENPRTWGFEGDTELTSDMYNASYPAWVVNPTLKGYDEKRLIKEALEFGAIFCCKVKLNSLISCV